MQVEHVRNIILNKARKEFLLHGIKAVKMDDIAASLHMSKRTLYEVYDNKRDLVADVLMMQSMQLKQRMHEFAEGNNNPMDTLLEFFRIQLDNYTQTNPQFYIDMRKYPDVLESLEAYNEGFKRDSQEFFRKGVEDGYFLPNVNFELLSRLCHNAIRNGRSNPEYQKYDLKEMFYSFVCVVIRGFCTQKGVSLLDEFLGNVIHDEQ